MPIENDMKPLASLLLGEFGAQTDRPIWGDQTHAHSGNNTREPIGIG